MSAEAGGGILGLLILLALAGPIISAALTILLVGGAVAAAVAAAVGAARLINKGARAAHRKFVEESIRRQAGQGDGRKKLVIVNAQNKAGQAVAQKKNLTQAVADQRRKLLEEYNQQSEQIEQLSEQQEKERSELLKQAKAFDGRRREQFEQIERRAAQMGAQTAQQTRSRIGELNNQVNESIRAWQQSVTDQLSARRAQIDTRLRQISGVIERDQTALQLVRQLKGEAEPMYTQLKAETDARQLVGDYLETIGGLEKDLNDLIAKGQGQAAVAAAVSYTQMIMETYNRLDAERHRRQLMGEQLNLSSAAIRAMVESGGTIGIEQGKNLPKDADYWAGGRLAPIMEEAKKLLAQVDEKKYRHAGDLEKLLGDINGCTERMDEVMYESRQAYICAFLRTQLMQKAQKGFQATGWKAQSWGFEKKDFRRPIIMRFVKENGAQADLLIAPVYDAVNRRYDVDVKIERRDPGVIDEGLREAQLKQLEQQLQAQGVPVNGMHCRKGTEGKNSLGPAVQNRFGLPGNEEGV